VIPNLQDVRHFRAVATARCGKIVALATWIVTGQFPAASASGSLGIFFLVKTPAGWRVWWKMFPP